MILIINFYTHVGGTDPAEAYHVKMTEEMIASLATTTAKQELFISHFKAMYQLNIN